MRKVILNSFILFFWKFLHKISKTKKKRRNEFIKFRLNRTRRLQQIIELVINLLV